MILLVAQGLARSNNDTVASMNAQRVEVLHIADSNGVVGSIADHFVLQLLPAFQRLLNQDLRDQGQRLGGEVAELLLVIREP